MYKMWSRCYIKGDKISWFIRLKGNRNVIFEVW